MGGGQRAGVHGWGPELKATPLCISLCGCCNRRAHTWWLRTQIYSLTVLEFTSPRSVSPAAGRVSAGLVPSGGPGVVDLIPCASQLLEVPTFLGWWPLPGVPWPLLCGHISTTLTLSGVVWHTAALPPPTLSSASAARPSGSHGARPPFIGPAVTQDNLPA